MTMSKARVEIHCPACGNEALLIREPVYQGFTRTGETLRCSACGHVFPNEAAVPFKHTTSKPLFSKAELPTAPQVFEADENKRLCRYCAHYIVNPFTQWCSVHKKEVAATDTCNRFEPSPEPEDEADDNKD
jgi:predicted RNA-binding Zn-ribbon protein involved in translation (DUF1610 family)